VKEKASAGDTAAGALIDKWVAAAGLGEPATNRELFDRLAVGGWISSALAAKLGDMAGFRNVLVHGYQDVDLDVVVDAAKNRLGDVVAFVNAIRQRLTAR
jgi:uncharacterized protein YutE (UPF0331/DUF86 family)